MKRYPLKKPCDCVFYDAKYQECDFELFSKYLSPRRVPVNCPLNLGAKKASVAENTKLILEAIRSLEYPTTKRIWKQIGERVKFNYKYFVGLLAYLAKIKRIEKHLGAWKLVGE